MASLCCKVRGLQAQWACQREARAFSKFIKGAEATLVTLYRCSTRQLPRSLRPLCWVAGVELFFDGCAPTFRAVLLSPSLLSRALAADIAFVLRLPCTRRRLSLLPANLSVPILSTSATTRSPWGTRHRWRVGFRSHVALPRLMHRFFVRVIVQHIVAIGPRDSSVCTSAIAIKKRKSREQKNWSPYGPTMPVPEVSTGY